MINPEWVTAIATSFGALAIFYVAAEKRSHLPRLRFDFKGGNSSIDGEHGQFSLEQEGVIRNLSFTQDTVSTVGVIVFKKGTKRYTYFATPPTIKITNMSEGQDYSVPFNIPARVAVKIKIKLKDWHIDKTFINALEQNKLNPSFDVKFCFETIDGVFLSDKGKPLDIPSMGAHWVLEQDKPSILSERYWSLTWDLTKSRATHRSMRIKRFFGFV